jgi:hypothetical protein
MCCRNGMIDREELRRLLESTQSGEAFMFEGGWVCLLYDVTASVWYAVSPVCTIYLCFPCTGGCLSQKWTQ